MRESLATLHALGARPAAALVARRMRERGALDVRRLRERGALDVRRGPRPRTLSNPAGLTPRQLEVFALLAQGERNADIAVRLFLSEKTVDHHVSAILDKLGVATRGTPRPRRSASASPRGGPSPRRRAGSPPVGPHRFVERGRRAVSRCSS